MGSLALGTGCLQVNGLIVFHAATVVQIVLNKGDPLAKELCSGLADLLAPEQVAVILGEI